MIRRLFWLTVGFGAGLGTSVWAQRQVRRFMRRSTPRAVADRVADGAAAMSSDVRHAWRAGRFEMRRREQELRTEWEVPAGNGARGVREVGQ